MRSLKHTGIRRSPREVVPSVQTRRGWGCLLNVTPSRCGVVTQARPGDFHSSLHYRVLKGVATKIDLIHDALRARRRKTSHDRVHRLMDPIVW